MIKIKNKRDATNIGVGWDNKNKHLNTLTSYYNSLSIDTSFTRYQPLSYSYDLPLPFYFNKEPPTKVSYDNNYNNYKWTSTLGKALIESVSITIGDELFQNLKKDMKIVGRVGRVDRSEPYDWVNSYITKNGQVKWYKIWDVKCSGFYVLDKGVNTGKINSCEFRLVDREALRDIYIN